MEIKQKNALTTVVSYPDRGTSGGGKYRGNCSPRLIEDLIVSPSEKSVEVCRLDGADLSLYDVYSVYPDWMLKKMKEEERAAVVMQFQCSLYDDLDISLDDIFSGLVP